jgi:hypothetical protein
MIMQRPIIQEDSFNQIWKFQIGVMGILIENQLVIMAVSMPKIPPPFSNSLPSLPLIARPGQKALSKIGSGPMGRPPKFR